MVVFVDGEKYIHGWWRWDVSFLSCCQYFG